MHPFVLGVVGTLAAVAVLVAHVQLARAALENRLPRLRRQQLPRRVGREAHLVGEGVQQPGEVVGDVGGRPRRDRPLVERLARVGDDQLRVDDHPGAEPVAVGAGAERRVEREGPRLELLERQVVVHAGEVLGEHPLAVRVVVGQVDEVERHEAAGQPQGGLDGVGEPRFADRFTASRSTTTSIVCFFCLSSFGGSVSAWISPSVRAREKPCACS